MTEYFENWVDRMVKAYISSPLHIVRMSPIKTTGSTTIIINTKTLKTGIAKCHPNDTFNEDIGIAIAYARCIGKRVPNMDYEPPKKDFETIEVKNNRLMSILNIIGETGSWTCKFCPCSNSCLHQDATCQTVLKNYLLGKKHN